MIETLTLLIIAAFFVLTYPLFTRLATRQRDLNDQQLTGEDAAIERARRILGNAR